jgi:large subunit ribosomal protein L19e
MNLKTKKHIAAKVLKCSPKKVKFETSALDKLSEAITRSDIKALISKSVISRKKDTGVSRGRAKLRAAQRKKGRGTGHGNRRGKATARTDSKLTWMNKIRLQRELLASLKKKALLNNTDYRDLYQKSKGGFFRSVRHLKLYITEHEFVKNNK